MTGTRSRTSRSPRPVSKRPIARRRPTALLVGTALVAIASLGACGSDGPNDGAQDTAAPATDAATPTVAASDAATETVPDSTTNDATNDTTGTSPQTAPTSDASYLTFVDDRGEELTFAEPPTRVVAWQAMFRHSSTWASTPSV